MVNTMLGIVFLKESYAPVILQTRRHDYEKEGVKARLDEELESECNRPMTHRLFEAMQRPLRILFLQPIVFTMVGVAQKQVRERSNVSRRYTRQSLLGQPIVCIQISKAFTEESMASPLLR